MIHSRNRFISKYNQISRAPEWPIQILVIDIRLIQFACVRYKFVVVIARVHMARSDSMHARGTHTVPVTSADGRLVTIILTLQRHAITYAGFVFVHTL
jgi:hypothetical protein